MAHKNVEHNRLLLTYNMLRGGMNVMAAWKSAGEKIKRSKSQLNRQKSPNAQIDKMRKQFMKGDVT